MTVVVTGRVQGVGFRYWVRQEAQSLGLVGSATNLRDGRVEVVAEGTREACETLLATLQSQGTPGRVTDVAASWSESTGEPEYFRVR